MFIALFAFMFIIAVAIIVISGVAKFATTSKETKKSWYKLIGIIVLMYAGGYCLLRLSTGLINRYYLGNEDAPLF